MTSTASASSIILWMAPPKSTPRSSSPRSTSGSMPALLDDPGDRAGDDAVPSRMADIDLHPAHRFQPRHSTPLRGGTDGQLRYHPPARTRRIAFAKPRETFMKSIVVTGASTGIGWGCVKVLTAKGFMSSAPSANRPTLTGSAGVRRDRHAPPLRRDRRSRRESRRRRRSSPTSSTARPSSASSTMPASPIRAPPPHRDRQLPSADGGQRHRPADRHATLRPAPGRDAGREIERARPHLHDELGGRQKSARPSSAPTTPRSSRSKACRNPCAAN